MAQGSHRAPFSFAAGRRPPGAPLDVAGLVAELTCGQRCPCQTALRHGRGLVHCPAHPDRSPSLSVHERGGRLLVHCMAGCAQSDVVQALRERDLWPGGGDGSAAPAAPPNPPPSPVRVGSRTEYHYLSAEGALLASHVREMGRDGKKRMWWQDPFGRPSKNGAVRPETLPLYRLRVLLAAPLTTPVLLVEGERCADAAVDAGAIAVSLAGGASQRDFGGALEPLRGRTVVLWPDADPPGRALMAAVAAALLPIAAAVRWVEPDELAEGALPRGYDVADWLAAGNAPAALQGLLAGAGPVPQEEETAAGESLPAAALFPLYALPPVLREVVAQGAAALDCPPDLLAGPALAFTAAALGHRYALELKPGWNERAILWLAVVAVPGSAKSPALALAQRGLSLLQQEARDRHRSDLAAYEQAQADWQADKRPREQGGRPERPEMRHYLSTDPTPEAIARILGHPQSCTRGLVVVRDELVAFVRSFDAYKGGRGGERQAWLSLWAGSEFKSDRAGREPYFVVQPTVSVVGGIQPDMLGALQGEAGQRDGFIERFLFCYPQTRPMRWTDETVAPAALTALAAAWRTLAEEGPAVTVQLGELALVQFRLWVDENAMMQERTQGLLRGVFSKLPAYLGRLTLVLHALAHPHNAGEVPVSGETMAAAIDLTEYFREGAVRTLACFGEEASALPPATTRVLRFMRMQDGWVTRSKLHRHFNGHLRASDLTAALTELEVMRMVESQPVPVGEQGGRSTTVWRMRESARYETTG